MAGPDMSKVHIVYPQIEAASDGDPGRCCEGYYTAENSVVTMTDPEGLPIRDVEGEKITHKLASGERTDVIARRLTLKIYHARRDDMADFNRPTASLKYQKICY
jgi:hypothetical protein